MAIDTDALAELSQLRVEASTPATQTGAARLPATKFALKPVGGAYAEAMGQMQRGQLPVAGDTNPVPVSSARAELTIGQAEGLGIRGVLAAEEIGALASPH